MAQTLYTSYLSYAAPKGLGESLILREARRAPGGGGGQRFHKYAASRVQANVTPQRNSLKPKRSLVRRHEFYTLNGTPDFATLQEHSGTLEAPGELEAESARPRLEALKEPEKKAVRVVYARKKSPAPFDAA